MDNTRTEETTKVVTEEPRKPTTVTEKTTDSETHTAAKPATTEKTHNVETRES